MTYKPLASAEQSDLEFLIPADNDTYVDLNIKLYIRRKLIKADGTNLDNDHFTAVTNNFLHSLFSQCSIALNGVTITQATVSITIDLFRDPIDVRHLHRSHASDKWVLVPGWR